MEFSDLILDWYAANGRDLPCRRSRDAYGIWLCEVIMQQTRIAQGTAYWERFRKAFPRVEDLAAASEDEVLRLWEGLGYYSRARNLHAAARQIVEMGGFPTTLEGIRSLKGVGDYTAAAIASIAFGIPAAVVDGNVYRVLSRVYGVDTPVGTTAAKKEFAALAQSLIPLDRPGDFNEGMMDFGAMQCTPSAPDCSSCPLRKHCVAYKTKRVGELPVKKEGPAIRERYLTYIYVRVNGKTAFRKRPAGDIWQGLWEPFLLESPPISQDTQSPEARSQGARLVLQDHVEWPAWTAGGTLTLLRKGVRHQLTHRTLMANFYLFESPVQPALPEGYVWIDESELDRIGKPRLVEILLDAACNEAK